MFQNLLKKIARSLEKTSIPYMVIGGQAVLLYGEPRLTKDINTNYDSQYIVRWLKVFDRSLNENFLEVFKKIEKDIK